MWAREEEEEDEGEVGVEGLLVVVRLSGGRNGGGREEGGREMRNKEFLYNHKIYRERDTLSLLLFDIELLKYKYKEEGRQGGREGGRGGKKVGARPREGGFLPLYYLSLPFSLAAAAVTP